MHSRGNQLRTSKPWKLSFSYGRALQGPALEAWRGRDENLVLAQAAFYHRARLKAAACVGKHTDEMEVAFPTGDESTHPRDDRYARPFRGLG